VLEGNARATRFYERHGWRADGATKDDVRGDAVLRERRMIRELAPGGGWGRRVEIRPAIAADWPSIWPFFHDIVEAGETYAYPLELSSEAAEGLWFEVPPGTTIVALDGGAIIGSAKAGPNRPGRGAHVATASFMVSPEHGGKGVGRALGEYVLEWARTAGFHSMQFNAVVETNAGAIRLWQSLGFDIIGTVPRAFDHRSKGLVGLHVMYRQL
jgi:GNAT superfamily N-acetyltransferase